MAYSDEVLADTPAAYWKFDETSGTAAADSSGNALTATHTVRTGAGVPTVNQSPLIKTGKSVLYMNTGANRGYTIRADNALLDFGDVGTLEAWVTLSSLGGTIFLIGKGTNSLSSYINLSNRLVLFKYDVADIVASTVTMTTGQTYHCVVTKNGATCKVYINGADVTGTVTNQTCVSTASSLIIGAYDTAGTFEYDGKIDEVAVYPTALSATRIAAHYAAGITAGRRTLLGVGT